MPGVPVPSGTASRLGGPIRRSSDHRFLPPPRRISQVGTSFVGARAEPFPRQHVSHGPVGLAHVQDAYDRYQWTLCHRRLCASSGLYPFPFDARARRGCTSVSASKTGCQWCRALVSETPFTMRWAYLILVSGLPLDFVDPRLEPSDFLASDFTHMGTFRKQNLGSDGGTEDEHDDDPASGEDRHVRPDGTVSPHDEGNEYEYG